jgi:uncharacterized protein (TIRG00374 family)
VRRFMASRRISRRAPTRDVTSSRCWRALSAGHDRLADTLSAARPLSSGVSRIRASTLFNLAALAVGIVAFAIVVAHLGWTGIEAAVLGTGAWFAVIAAIDLLSASCDAFAIHGFLRKSQPVSYCRVFAAQLSGMAINRLTPGNTLGEPVKVTMLVRSVPTDAAVPAIVMFNLTTIYVAIATIVLGVPLTALFLDLPERVVLAVWIGVGLLLSFAVALALLVRRGAIGSLVDVLVATSLISATRGARWKARIATIDRRIRSIGDARHSGLARGIAGVVGSRVLNGVGTVVVLHAADIPLTAPLVIAMLSVGILVTWISNIIPLGLGIADGTNYVLYGLLGASPTAGLLLTLVNRLRTVMLALLGLSTMAIANAVHRRNAGVSGPSVSGERPRPLL